MSTLIPFIGEIFSQLQAAADTPILAEIREGDVTGVTGGELLELVRKARTFIASKGLQKGDRCGLLAANSIRWVAMDLALMAEGLIVVPLYSRQAPVELVAMMKDCTPSLVCCGDAALRDGIAQVGRKLRRSFCLMRFLPVWTVCSWIGRRWGMTVRWRLFIRRGHRARPRAWC